MNLFEVLYTIVLAAALAFIHANYSTDRSALIRANTEIDSVIRFARQLTASQCSPDGQTIVLSDLIAPQRHLAFNAEDWSVAQMAGTGRRRLRYTGANQTLQNAMAHRDDAVYVQASAATGRARFLSLKGGRPCP